jgi:outer membrane biosynthesis protein TonB
MPERAELGPRRGNVPFTVFRVIRRPVLALVAVATVVVAGCGAPPADRADQQADVETAVPDDSTDTFPAATTTPAPASSAVASPIPAPPPAPRPKPIPKPKPKPAPKPPAPKPAPKPAPRGNCDPSYPTVCIPPAPPDLDCGDVPYDHFQVVGADPHGFDNDHDGVGCES